MSNWFILSLISPAIYAVVNFIDKYLLSKEFSDYRSLPIFTGIIGLIAGTTFWLLTDFLFLPYWDSIILLFVGVLTIFSLVVYFKALTLEDTSTVIILFQMVPVITLILSYVFLNESISMMQLIGFFLVIAASLWISIPEGKTTIRISKSFVLILVCDLMWAVSAILMKYVLSLYSFSQVIAYESWGIALGAVIIVIFLPSFRRVFLKRVRTLRLRSVLVLMVNELVYILAKSLTFFAYSLGPVALVSVLGSTQTFYGIIFGYILTMFFPKIFKEDIQKATAIKKALVSTLLFAGVWMVY